MIGVQTSQISGTVTVCFGVDAFRLKLTVMLVAAAVIESDLLWNISDTANGLIALPNLVAVVLLSGQVVKITRNYYARKKGEDVEPMLSAYPEQNKEFIEDLD
ncbi:MAG: alanine:cation symporter family protein [Clostridia bacterium]|nr:alanine:cation symporter family protein [Clostridia bacterium]